MYQVKQSISVHIFNIRCPVSFIFHEKFDRCHRVNNISANKTTRVRKIIYNLLIRTVNDG